jgi:hypothetical protein
VNLPFNLWRLNLVIWDALLVLVLVLVVVLVLVLVLVLARAWIAGGLGAERRPGMRWLTNGKLCARQSTGRITCDVAVIQALLRNGELIYTP